MKRFLLLAIVFSVTSIHAAAPPTKRGGGLFSFGAQKSAQISAGLFPERGSEAAATYNVVTSSSAPAGGGSDIFRMGQPKPVDAVSYVIQNGRKVDRPIAMEAPVAATPAAETAAPPVIEAPAETSGVELASGEGRKRGGLFAFGRRGDNAEENEVVTPIPAESGFAPPRATPSAAPAQAPLVAVPARPVAVPATPVSVPATPVAPAVVVETADTPNFAGVKKEKGEKSRWLPFLSRRKQDSAPEMAAPAPAVIAAAEPVPVAVPMTPATTASAPPAKPAAPNTVAASAPSATFEVPRDESKKEEKKEVKPGSSGGGILSPIANIRVPRKEIDLSSAETIIQNGEIVAGSETNFETVTDSGSSAPRQAPQIVNGVKTYSSWDDITARSSSAADKIIGSMR